MLSGTGSFRRSTPGGIASNRIRLSVEPESRSVLSQSFKFLVSLTSLQMRTVVGARSALVLDAVRG